MSDGAGMDTTVHQQRFCAGCGAEVGEARFCRKCGAEQVTQAGAAVAPLPPTEQQLPAGPWLGSGPPSAPRTSAPPAPPQPSSSGSKLPWIAGGVAGLVVLGVIAAILLSSSGGTNSTSSYRQSLAGALGPLVSANSNLGSSLQSLSGSDDSAQKAALTQTQTALTTAQGAVGAISVPSSATQLSQQTQQALADENGYLQEVASLLGTPSQNAAAQIQPLATSATAALVPLNALVAGASGSISGVSTLVSWGQGQASAAQHSRTIAQQRELQQAARSASQPSSGGSGGGSSAGPLSSSQQCGGGVVAGPNTSCAFALNVQQAWQQAPGTTNTVDVYSPVTGQTYTMTCGPAGTEISCSGANNASVTFPG